MTDGLDIDDIARPVPKKDRWGRYIIEGQSYTRATTVAATLDDTTNLSKWQQRMAIKGLTLRDDLLAQAHALDPDHDKGKFNKLCDEARNAAKANRGANLGDALHAFTENVDTGRLKVKDLSQPYRGFVESYRQLLDANGVTIVPEYTEQIVAHVTNPGGPAKPGVAGTMDRVVELVVPGDAHRSRIVGDIKTGSTLDWSWLYISIQLAIYATHTHTYDPATDTLGPPVPDLRSDVGLVIHLPSNGDEPTLHLINLEQGFDAYLCAMEARGYRKGSKKLAVPYGAPPVDLAVRRLEDNGMTDEGPRAEREWLMGRVQRLPAEAVDDLRSRWPDHIPQPFPEQPTSQQVDEMHELLTRIEAMHEMPFDPEGRPGLETKRKLAEWLTA